MKEGTIVPIFEERLKQMGDLLKSNGEAIYGTKPWKYQNDSMAKNPDVWYTAKNEIVYAIMLGNDIFMNFYSNGYIYFSNSYCYKFNE